MEWCQPWQQVNHVIVDLSFDLLVHCDQPKSCVAHAENLMHKQGYHYNFIIGDEDLVFVGKGYTCKSDAMRLQMLITRYSILLNKISKLMSENMLACRAKLCRQGRATRKLAICSLTAVHCRGLHSACLIENVNEYLLNIFNLSIHPRELKYYLSIRFFQWKNQPPKPRNKSAIKGLTIKLVFI